MDVQEIFYQIINHMLEGMMIHEQLMNYFDFLALEGYKVCHYYRYIDETLNHNKIQQYYVEHYNRLLPEPQPNIIQVIPFSWYNYTRQEIDESTKREGILKGMTAWKNWERETKELYEKSFNNLLSIGEVAGAEKIRELIVDVDKELAEAETMYLEIISIKADLSVIIPQQREVAETFSKKFKKIKFI